MIDPNVKLIVIVGPTASGKTDLSLNIAEMFGGEIICADSRTIYKGMDIGTAKPTEAERAQIPHYLLDVIEPDETLNAAKFKELAERAIAQIADSGELPIMVGGSGLYIDSVIYDYQFAGEADAARRTELEALSDEELIERLRAVDSEAYENVDLKNRRRVVRALETAGQTPSRLDAVRPGTLVLGLTLNKEIAQSRISARVKKMLGEGFIDEVKEIGDKYGWDSDAFNVIGYRAFKDVVLGAKTLEQGTEDFVRGDMALYKKQMTWFKRNNEIVWLDDPAQAEGFVRRFLD